MPDDAGHPIRPEPSAEPAVGPPSRWAEMRRAQDADPEGGLRRAREWAAANRASINSINAYIRENGVWGEEWRAW